MQFNAVISVDASRRVSNVSIFFAELPWGSHVLDPGRGAGLDSLIAGPRVGTDSRIVGLDVGKSV